MTNSCSNCTCRVGEDFSQKDLVPVCGEMICPNCKKVLEKRGYLRPGEGDLSWTHQCKWHKLTNLHYRQMSDFLYPMEKMTIEQRIIYLNKIEK